MLNRQDKVSWRFYQSETARCLGFRNNTRLAEADSDVSTELFVNEIQEQIFLTGAQRTEAKSTHGRRFQMFSGARTFSKENNIKHQNLWETFVSTNFLLFGFPVETFSENFLLLKSLKKIQ